MKRINFWYVECTHAVQQYNDNATYAIFNDCGNAIVVSGNKELLEQICLKHNECFLDDESEGK